MKKEKSPVLVFCCIIFLLSFIILPPFFRSTNPKEQAVNINGNQVKLKVLKCNKYFKQELYKVSTSTKYINNVIDTNTITYEKVEQIPAEVLDNTSITVSQEYGMLSSLQNINISNNGNLTIVKIDKNIINSNSGNLELLKYYQDITKQRGFYESMGYTCNVLES